VLNTCSLKVPEVVRGDAGVVSRSSRFAAEIGGVGAGGDDNGESGGVEPGALADENLDGNVWVADGTALHELLLRAR